MRTHRLVAPCLLQAEQAPRPEERSLHKGEVLVRVEAGGICGSDLAPFKGVPPWRVRPHLEPAFRTFGPPGYPLHEIVGQVTASSDPDLPVGSRVVGWASRDDGLSEYVVADGQGLAAYDLPLPATSVVMLQPLACVLYAASRLSGVAGARVAVLGQGPIGLLFSRVLRAMGAREVVGVDPVDRRDVAAVFGVDDAVRSRSDRWAASLDPGERPDIVVEAVGHQVATLVDAIEAVAPGGQIYYFGIPDDQVYPLPMGRFMDKGVQLLTGLTRDRRQVLVRAGAFVREHPELVDAFVTHALPVEEAQAAFELAVRPAPGQLKIVLRGE